MCSHGFGLPVYLVRDHELCLGLVGLGLDGELPSCPLALGKEKRTTPASVLLLNTNFHRV